MTFRVFDFLTLVNHVTSQTVVIDHVTSRTVVIGHVVAPVVDLDAFGNQKKNKIKKSWCGDPPKK